MKTIEAIKIDIDFIAVHEKNVTVRRLKIERLKQCILFLETGYNESSIRNQMILLDDKIKRIRVLFVEWKKQFSAFTMPKNPRYAFEVEYDLKRQINQLSTLKYILNERKSVFP